MGDIMPKIKVIINEEELVTESTITNDIIKYQEENGTNTTLDLNNNTLVRENNDIYMKYDFNKKTGTLEVKELNKVLDLKINNVHIYRDEKVTEIKYNIDEEEFIYRVEVL